MASVRANCWKPICGTWLTPTAPLPARSLSYSNSFANTGQTLWRVRLRRHRRRVPWVLTTLPISFDSSNRRAGRSHPCRSEIRSYETLLPIPYRCWPMTLSFLTLERNIMTSLEQKLQQLNLAAISHQIEQTIAEAIAKNMSVAATLEWLADMELEARTGRAIDRRFKSSRLQLRPSIDGFQFHHHKSRVQAKNRILRLLDLNFLREGTNLVLIGNPGVGKTFLAKVIGWKACQANQRVLFTTAMDMLNQLSASQVDHSLVRKLKAYTEPSLLICDELGYLALDQQTSNLFYQVISTRHSQKKSTVITTNTPFSDWGNILYNTTIATAIADRLVENSEIFLLGGDSLRKANKNSSSPEE
jgi:DNA replication protein DnaC